MYKKIIIVFALVGIMYSDEGFFEKYDFELKVNESLHFSSKCG